MSKWPLVPLGELVTQDTEATQVSADQEYPNLGIYSFGRGLFEKPPISGTTTSAKHLYRVKAGQFIYSRLFAFEGAYGLVSDDLDGRYVSNEYPHFDCNPDRVLPGFLATYFRASSTWEKAATLTTGMGDRRRRIKPEQLVKMEIPLPPLPEQQKIVEWIDAVATRIEEAKGLHIERAAQLAQLFDRAADEIFDEHGWRYMPLGSLLIEDSRNGLGARPSGEPSGTPILRISAGTSRTDAVVEESDHKYLQITEQELETYRLRKGDLLACRFNGNLRYVGRFSVYQEMQSDDRVYPDKLIRFRVDRSKVDPEFVVFAMNSPAGRRVIEGFCQTTAGNIGISAKVLKTIEVPVPPPEVQSKVIGYLKEAQAKLTSAAQLTKKVGGEVDAILPSILNKVFNEEESAT
jgi:type I restriction enzyme S subunit